MREMPKTRHPDYVNVVPKGFNIYHYGCTYVDKKPYGQNWCIADLRHKIKAGSEKYTTIQAVKVGSPGMLEEWEPYMDVYKQYIQIILASPYAPLWRNEEIENGKVRFWNGRSWTANLVSVSLVRNVWEAVPYVFHVVNAVNNLGCKDPLVALNVGFWTSCDKDGFMPYLNIHFPYLSGRLYPKKRVTDAMAKFEKDPMLPTGQCQDFGAMKFAGNWPQTLEEVIKIVEEN